METNIQKSLETTSAAAEKHCSYSVEEWFK